MKYLLIDPSKEYRLEFSKYICHQCGHSTCPFAKGNMKNGPVLRLDEFIFCPATGAVYRGVELASMFTCCSFVPYMNQGFNTLVKDDNGYYLTQ